MTKNSFASVPIQNLKRAIVIREKIEALTHELNDLTGISPYLPHNGNGNGNGTSKPQGLSSAGRARIAAAQRIRWMRFHATTGNGNGNGAGHSTRSQRLSPAGRARVSAAVKARWERYRAAKARNGNGRGKSERLIFDQAPAATAARQQIGRA